MPLFHCNITSPGPRKVLQASRSLLPAWAGVLALLTVTPVFDAHAAAHSPLNPLSHAATPVATAMEPPPLGGELPAAVAAPVAVPALRQPRDPQVLGESLQEAARTGNAAEIRFLVRQGARLDAIDEGNRTPLMLAVIFNQPRAVKQLLALDANPDAKDTEGLTALLHARKLGLPRIARLLAKR